MTEKDYFWYKQIASNYTFKDYFNPVGDENIWIPWKKAIYYIDHNIGRNRMMFFLKLKGLLGYDNLPKIGVKDFDFFKCESIKYSTSKNTHYYNDKIFFINSIGVIEIRQMIRDERARGASI